MPEITSKLVRDAAAKISAAIPEAKIELLDFDTRLDIAIETPTSRWIVNVCGIKRFENDPPTFFNDVDTIIRGLRSSLDAERHSVSASAPRERSALDL